MEFSVRRRVPSGVSRKVSTRQEAKRGGGAFLLCQSGEVNVAFRTGMMTRTQVRRARVMLRRRIDEAIIVKFIGEPIEIIKAEIKRWKERESESCGPSLKVTHVTGGTWIEPIEAPSLTAIVCGDPYVPRVALSRAADWQPYEKRVRGRIALSA